MKRNKLMALMAVFLMTVTVSAQVTFTCTGGTNFEGDEGVAKLFDSNRETKYCGNCGNDVYALIEASEPVYVWGYDMTTANDNEAYDRCIGKWQLFGTNDAAVAADPSAAGWVALSDLGRNEMVQRKNYFTQRFFCEKGVTKSFKYFKLVLNERKKYKENDQDRYDGMIQLSEFKILGEPNRVVSYKWKASSQDNSKKAVDLLIGQKWEGSNLANGKNWVTIETSDGQAYAVKSYSFSTHDDGSWNDRAPKSWKIEGSNDNSNWTLIDEVVNDNVIQNLNFSTFEFTPSNTTDKFRYIKLTLNAMKSDGWTQVGEFHVVSTSDVSDAQYYTNLVNAAKATKAEYESLLGENDSWCQEYATFFAGLDLDNLLAAGIQTGEYATLETKLKAAEENVIAKAVKLFVNGANYAAIAGSDCWGDGNYSQLVDGKESTKWGGNDFPQYVIFRVKAAFKPFFYKLVTGNDTEKNTGRNWKSWSVYGGNFATFNDATNKDATEWVLLDERTDVTEEYLPMKNFYPATFDFNKGVAKDYLYYMVKVTAPHSGSQQQMSEMYLCTQDEFEAIRKPLVDELTDFAAGVADIVVESDLEASKTIFTEKFAELQTTSDAVALTKIYNELVSLKDALSESADFMTGGYRPISGNTAWSDGENHTKLLDGNEKTKWGGNLPEGGSYVIFKAYAAKAFNQYMLVTGNDTKGNSGRNWKSWKIYGCNAKVPSGSEESKFVTRDFSSWVLLDAKSDIGKDRLPADNFAPAYFNISEKWESNYKYFKIEVESAFDGGSIQMSEFKFLPDEEFTAIRQEYVDSLTKVSMALANLEEGLEMPDAIKQKLIAQLTETITAKITAVATATADDLLPNFNGAINYITTEVPAIIAANTMAQVDGVYQINAAQQLVNFATIVNSGATDAKAVLTADIDLSEVITNNAWTSIGNNDKPFKGTFDGQGNTIKNITYTATGQYNGLFGKLTTGAVVKNFTAEGTMTVSASVTGRAVALIGVAGDGGVLIQNINSKMNYNNQLAGAQVGGVLGGALNGNATVVDRCTYSGKLAAEDGGKDGNYGGLVGYANNNAACYLTISNCLFDGELVNTAATPGNCTFGGMIGYSNGANVSIKNVLSIGTVQSKIAAQFFGAVKSTRSSINNSYYKGENVNGSASTVTMTANKVADEQLASNEIVLKLGVAFRQDVGKDAYPTLDLSKPVVTEISEAGYATLFVDNVDLEIPEGVVASAGLVWGNLVDVQPIEGKIAAGEPVILKGEAGVYSFAPTTGAVKAERNDLKGAAEDVEATGKYVLAKPEDAEVGFYLANAGTIKAGKAYLELPATEVKAFYFAENGETAINSLTPALSEGEGAIYNIAGQRVSKLQKGINIVNGKKILK